MILSPSILEYATYAKRSTLEKNGQRIESEVTRHMNIRDASEIRTHLTGDVTVGETHYKTVLRGVVFVFVLDSQAFAGIVVSLSFTTPLELNLVPLEVLLILDYLDETLERKTDALKGVLMERQREH